MSSYFSEVPNFEYVSRLPDSKISDYITVKNLFKRGFLREGYWADIVIVNPSQNTSVQESELYSKCQWSPFPHMTFTNSIETPISLT